MNIFVLDYNPRLAAEYHCDRHVLKMVLETAQLLSTAHEHYGTWQEGMYKPTHKNHPCSIWVRESRDNYIWTLNLGLWLLYEYEKRYKKIHKTSQVMELLRTPPKKLHYSRLTRFAQAMPEEYQREDAVEAYRTYYMLDKAPICTWKTKIPWWFTHREFLPKASS